MKRLQRGTTEQGFLYARLPLNLYPRIKTGSVTRVGLGNLGPGSFEKLGPGRTRIEKMRNP